MLPVVFGFEFVDKVEINYDDTCSHWDKYVNPEDTKNLRDVFFSQLKCNKEYKKKIRKERCDILSGINA